MGLLWPPSAVELQYRRAVRADSDSALILRQLDTYFSLYDEIGRGEKMFACPLCRYGRLCELCYLTAVRDSGAPGVCGRGGVWGRGREQKAGRTVVQVPVGANGAPAASPPPLPPKWLHHFLYSKLCPCHAK